MTLDGRGIWCLISKRNWLIWELLGSVKSFIIANVGVLFSK